MQTAPQLFPLLEGASKINHLDGSCCGYNRDFQLRRVDTLSNPSDLGNQVFGWEKVRLYSRASIIESDTLRADEFHEEQAKKKKRKQLQSIRMVIHK